MPSTPVLTVTNDDTFLSLLRAKLRDHLGPKGRIMVAATVDEASPLLKTARPRLIVVHLASDSGRYEQLDRLLWATSLLSRPTPIVVIAERYRTDQATMMYRMGVAEYVSRTHHLDQLEGVLGAYLRPATLWAVASAEGDASAKIWRANRSASFRTAQVV
jgi:DNA-binding NarL/FixJ family response regulator